MKKLLPTTILTALLLNLQVIKGQQENTISHFVKRAKEKIHEKDYEEAFAAADVAIAACPSCYEAYMVKGDVFAESGELKKAIPLYKKAYAICKCIYPYLMMANYKAKAGLYDEAYKDLDELLKKDSVKNAAEVYGMKAHLLGLQKRYEESYYNFCSAYKLKKELFTLYRMMLNEVHTNRIDLLDEHLKAYIIQDADRNADLDYGRRGDVYSYMRKYDLAFTDYDKSLRLNPKNVFSYICRSIAAANTGKMNLALQDAEKAIALAPLSKEALNNRALIYIHLEKYDEAMRDLENVIAADSKMYYAYNNLGYIYYKLGGAANYKKALYNYDKAFEIAGPSYMPYWKYREAVAAAK